MTEIQLVSAKDREEMSLSARQTLDPDLAMVITYKAISEEWRDRFQ